MKTNNTTEGETTFRRCIRAVFGTDSAADSDSAAAATPAPAPAKPQNGKKILIVDDDPVYVKATSAMFSHQGYQVVTAKDGSEAIQAMREEKPNLVLMDIDLPSDVNMMSWDGFLLMSWLRRFDDSRKVPIVMVSGGDPLKFVRRALTGGARAFFHKSTNPNNLVSTVRLLLSDNFPSLQRPAIGNFQI